jgi:hypothetical protein
LHYSCPGFVSEVFGNPVEDEKSDEVLNMLINDIPMQTLYFMNISKELKVFS